MATPSCKPPPHLPLLVSGYGQSLPYGLPMSLEKPGPADDSVVDLAHEADFRLGSLLINPPTREVARGDLREMLEPRVMQVLVALYQANGRVASRDELIARCWEGRIVGEDAINRAIGRLRRLSDGDSGASFAIETVPRVGYRLILGSATIGQPPRRSSISICVLPFVNISGDVEQEYFSDGITEDIITDLSKVSSLLVVARNTAFTFKGKPMDVTLIAGQLGVGHILSGSVRKSGGRVRITAQLVDGNTGGDVWAERYDRDLSDIFALQDEISQTIVGALRLQLIPEEKNAIEERGTQSVEAYDLFLRAHALTEQMGATQLQRAITLYRNAISIDPHFRRALNGLIQALHNYARTVPQERAEALKEVQDTQERIIALEPSGWRALRTRAMQAMYRRDYLGAERLLDDALQTVSRSQESIGVRAWHQELVCRFHDAIETYRPMLRRDPLSLVVSFMMQSRLDAGGRPDEAQAEYERSKDLAGDRGMVEFLAFLRAWSCSTPDDARKQFQRFLANCDREMHVPCFDELEAVLSEPEKARDLIAHAVADNENQNAVRQAHLALLAGAFGAIDVALSAVRCAYVDLSLMPQRFLWLPAFAAVREDARFKDIVRDLGLYDYWRRSGKWGDFARPLGEDDFDLVK